MKMKIQELRVDSLVKYNGLILPISGIDSPKPMEDKRYTDKYILELFCEGFLYIALDDEKLEPVEITEEILLSCGFRKSERNTNFDYVLQIGTVLLYCRQHKKWYWQLDEVYLGDKFDHLHQLQNFLYDLNGIEIQVKNIKP